MDDTLLVKGIIHIKKYLLLDLLLMWYYNTGKLDNTRYNELGAWLLTVESDSDFAFCQGIKQFLK